MRQDEQRKSNCLLKVDEVAELLGVEPKTIYNWVYEGVIPYVKPTRGTLRFRPSAIAGWLEERTHEPRSRTSTRS